MKIRDLARGVFCLGTIAVACLSVQADVFTDCTAWYIGGKGTVGAFTNGDMTDIRHAAISDAPTHGGSLRSKNAGPSNLCETVYSAASGRTFVNQRTIYLPQTNTLSGTYKVVENSLTLPFAATNENYTLLFRVKLAETQPQNKAWVHVADLGYTGGNQTSNRYGFAIRYYPAEERFGLLYNNGTGTNKFAVATNDVFATLRGKWLEMSVSLQTIKKAYYDSKNVLRDKCRMCLGVATEGYGRVYYSYDYEFPSGQSVPKEGKIYLGSTSGYGGASSSCTPTRGSYQMISYWERVLSDDEILEAFRLQGPDGTAEQVPALLKVGDPAWSSDVCGATIEGTSATPSMDLQDLGKLPMQLAAGQTLNLPFTVPATCTNLRQIVRLSAAGGSSAASVQVWLDGQEIGVADVSPGQTAFVDCEAAAFTEGAHTLTLVRSDGGASPLKLDCVEVSGSWRLGWIDDELKPFQNDTASGKGVLTNAVANLSTNIWPSTRGTIKSIRHSALSTFLASEDVAKRRICLRAKPFEMPGSVFDCAVLANDCEVFRRKVDKDDPKRFEQIAITFPPESLKAGENVFTFLTDNLTSGTYSWLRFDYFELEVGTEPTGCMLLIR